MNPGQFVDRMRVEAAQQMIDSSAMVLRRSRMLVDFRRLLPCAERFYVFSALLAGEYASRLAVAQSQTEMHR